MDRLSPVTVPDTWKASHPQLEKAALALLHLPVVEFWFDRIVNYFYIRRVAGFFPRSSISCHSHIASKFLHS